MPGAQDEQTGNRQGIGGNVLAEQLSAHAVQSSGDTFLGRVFGNSQPLPDAGKGLVFEKTDQQSVSIRLTEARKGGVEVGLGLIRHGSIR